MFFKRLGKFTSTFTVTDNHLLSTFMMGLLNTFSAWIGNSQAFALNSIAEDSFALENLTYAVSHHTTTGLPHLYTLTNLYHSYGYGCWHWLRASPLGGSAFSINQL